MPVRLDVKVLFTFFDVAYYNLMQLCGVLFLAM